MASPRHRPILGELSLDSGDEFFDELVQLRNFRTRLRIWAVFEPTDSNNCIPGTEIRDASPGNSSTTWTIVTLAPDSSPSG